MLNESYHNELINKHSDFKDCDRLSDISATIILKNYSSKNIHFNFPRGYNLNRIINLLYKVFAKEIFKKFPDFPPDTCSKVKRIGGSKKDIFTIQTVQDDKVLLINTIDKSLKITLNYEVFLKRYIPVQQNAQKGVLLNIQKYFSSINEHDFLPTYFSKKLVLIAGQTIWNNLEDKNYIPSIYLPNSREGERTLLKSIPALEDCLVYVAPKYEVCYETLLKRNIGIDTIIVCDTDLNSLTQIIQDQTKYKFKLIVLSNENEVQRLHNLTLWNWQKEEIEFFDKTYKNNNENITSYKLYVEKQNTFSYKVTKKTKRGAIIEFPDKQRAFMPNQNIGNKGVSIRYLSNRQKLFISESILTEANEQQSIVLDENFNHSEKEAYQGNIIKIDCINDNELLTQIQHFEECMQYVSSLEIPVRPKSYSYFLRLALNALQEERFDYLLMRLKSNKELEHNEGGYEDFGDNNPKKALKKLISHLKETNPKLKKLNETISTTTKNTLYVVGREDIEIFKTNRNKNCQFITQKELKKIIKNGETYTKPIVFYTFNGSKDFDFIYNLPNNVQLVLYKQEEELYYKQLQIHTKQLETELIGEDRYTICGVKYEPIVKPVIKVSPTLEQIIERLEQRSNTAYDGYKDESDSLLDDLEEEITFRIVLANNSVVELESNETVFDEKGNLIKSYRLIIGNKIRIYPKEQLAENLFQIAVEVEPEKFGKIDEHSALWKNALNELQQHSLSLENLYERLKNNGLRVLPGTIEGYFRGSRKFPMFNTDLRAILKVAGKELLYEQIKKSKRLYNSTMIALGRGVKQELQQFLRDETVGDILQKKSFTKETLQKFINEYMPLLTILKIEEVGNEQ